MLNGALQDGFVQVMPAPLAGAPVDIHAGRREDPLPHPLAPSIWVFSSERRRQLDPAGSIFDVTTVLFLYKLQMTGELRLDRGGQHRHSVLVTLAASHDDLVRREVDVLHTQAAALQQPQPGPVEQVRHQAWRALQPAEHGPHLVDGQDHGQSLRSLGAYDAVEPREIDLEDAPVQEEHGAQRLVLGGSGDIPFDGERRQEAGDFRRSHLAGVAAARTRSSRRRCAWPCFAHHERVAGPGVWEAQRARADLSDRHLASPSRAGWDAGSLGNPLEFYNSAFHTS